MNIALFPSAFYPSLGGVEELTRQLALELKRQGHRVLIFADRWPRDLPVDEDFEGLQVRRYPMRVPASSFKSRLSFAATHRKIRSAIVAELRHFEPDVLHVQCVSSTTLYALYAQRALGVPLVVTLQGELTMDAARIFDKPGIAQTILRRALREANAITACSGKTLADGIAFLGHKPPAPSSVIFNGANGNEARSAKSVKRARPYVLALGRMVHQKGFDVLLDAIATRLPDDWELVLAGDGPLSGQIRDRVAQSDLRSKVDFIGRADRKQVPVLLRGCEFLIVPSRADEGLPVVCAEAISAGKPIVGTTMGGIPEAVVDGSTGLLVPPNDVEQLGNAISRLCSDLGLRVAMGKAAEARAAIFDWASVTAKYVDLYEKCAAGAVEAA